jgi:uncharacterized membrane protein YdjX (TVP38/TMEM64 family)
MTAPWKQRFWAAILLAVLAAVGVAAWQGGLLRSLADRERVVELLRAEGWKGPAVCVAVQFVQVVVFFIPGEITQFAAGYVFGAWKGFVFSAVGIMLGSAFDFAFARVVGRPTLEKMIPRPTMEKVDAALDNARGKSALFLLFLLPGMPKDAMSYGAGLSHLSFTEFMVVSGLARSPALAASVVLGSQANQRNYRAMIVTGVVVVIAMGGAYFYERRRSRRHAS